MALAELKYRIRGDGQAEAARDLKTLKSELSGAAGEAGRLESAMSRAGSGISRAITNVKALDIAGGAIRTTFTGIAGAIEGAGRAIAGFTGLSINNATSLDGNIRALALYTQNVGELKTEVDALREIAKAPGIDFTGAVTADIALRRYNLTLGQSSAIIKAFANQTAAAAKGPEEFNGVILAISQSIGKQKLEQEELNQITERGININGLLSRAFGTIDPQKINALGLDIKDVFLKIAEAESQLPRASGGFQTAIDNWNDSLRTARELLGTGIIRAIQTVSGSGDKFLEIITRISTQVGEVFQAIGSSGVLATVFDRISASFQRAFGGDAFDLFARFSGNILAFFGNLPVYAERAGAFVTAAFQTIGRNFGLVTKYIDDKWNITTTNIVDAIRGLGGILGAFVQSLPGAIGDVATDTIGGPIFAFLRRISPVNVPFILKNTGNPDVKFPKLEGLPDLSSIFDDKGLLKASDLIKKITDARAPLNIFPNDLTFGQGGDLPKKGEDANGKGNRFLDLLEKIEKNTKDGADALSLRRQALGGGPLARAGVTPQELASTGRRFAPVFISGSRSGTGDLARAVDRRINDAVSRRTGGGFRP